MPTSHPLGMPFAARRTGLVPLGCLVAALSIFACADGGSETQPLPSLDGGSDAPKGDGDVEASDASQTDQAPSTVSDLKAVATGYSTGRLEWTAPTDETGRASVYDVRFSTDPITNETEFLAASQMQGPPAPGLAGASEKFTLLGLANGATLHFALRSRDSAFHWSGVSNDAVVSLFPRARFQISEVAPGNSAAEGFDFIELVATAPGRAEGIKVTQVGATLYTFGTFSVALGDRVVIHAAGDPCPTGCANEDLSGKKNESTAQGAEATAWDVYTEASGITGTDNVISVVDADVATDVLAFSNRDADAASATMSAFAKVMTASEWTFPAAPVDQVNDCDTQKASVSVATSDTVCGGFPVFSAGKSLNRVAGADTNTKKDFYVAAQTPGLANTAPAAPAMTNVTVGSASDIKVTFDQEIDPATVLPANFVVSGGLTLGAVTLSDVHVVSIQTVAQTEGAPYSLTVGTALKSLQGVALAAADTRSFCGYSASGPTVVLNEIAPNVAGGTDLVELRVTKGGNVSGVQLRSNPASNGTGGTLLATLPAICAVANDLVVVHLHPAAAPLGALATLSETTKKDELPVSTYSGNFDGAYDVLSSNSQEISSLRVALYVRAADGATVLDAVPLQGSGTPTQGYLDAVTYLQSIAQWLPADCGGVVCDAGTVIPISASMSGVDTTASGTTVRRAPSADTQTNADFSVGAGSMGAPN